MEEILLLQSAKSHSTSKNLSFLRYESPACSVSPYLTPSVRWQEGFPCEAVSATLTACGANGK